MWFLVPAIFLSSCRIVIAIFPGALLSNCNHCSHIQHFIYFSFTPCLCYRDRRRQYPYLKEVTLFCQIISGYCIGPVCPVCRLSLYCSLDRGDNLANFVIISQVNVYFYFSVFSTKFSLYFLRSMPVI